MHSTPRVIALLAVLSCAAAAARAQYPQRRDGFWIGFGLGYGAANITCDNCVDSSSVGGITGFVKLGGAPSQNLLIGGTIKARARTKAGLTETNSNVTASGFLFPATRSGVFVTGGLGGFRYHTETFPSSDGP